MEEKDYNYGGLKGKVNPKQNIIYYRRGEDEMSINLTNRCPNSCVFCIRDKDKGWGVSNLYLEREPQLSEIKNEIFSAVKENKEGVDLVKICGYGEPLTRLEILPELVKFIRELLPEATIQLTTTGWLLYEKDNGPEKFQQSVENGIDRIYLSLNATEEQDYREIVRPSGENCFGRVIEFIKLSKNLDLEVECSFVDLDNLDEEKIRKFTSNLDCEYDIREFEQ